MTGSGGAVPPGQGQKCLVHERGQRRGQTNLVESMSQ